MTRDDQIAEIVMRWEEAFDHGRDIPVADLCADHPVLADDVTRRIAALKGMGWVKDAGTGGEREADARSIPQTLGGRYRIDVLIAEGGMGAVYRAYDPELDRPVAMKIPRPRGTTADQTDALVAEARRAAKLRHPGIVSVHDVGRDGDMCFIVADLIDGTNLADRIAQGPLPWREAVRLVSGVADALGFAHEQGFVHRDIKPANVLLDKTGRPLLTDFGIAATFDEAQRGGGPGGGTLPFMAPEQVAGEVQLIDARTDLYSLGVVLYEALTGKLPYQARTPTALREQILFRPPVPVRSLAPGVPEAVEAVVARCLAKHPADRFGSAAELAAALHNTLTPLPSARTVVRWARTAGLIVVGLLVLGLTAAVVRLWPRPTPTTDPPEAPQTAGRQPESPTPFVADGVMHFDGSTRIVTPVERFAPCTLEGWVWPEEYRDTGTQAVIGSDIPTKYGISLGVTGVVPFVEIIPGLLKGTQPVPLKKWTHLAGVFGEGETRLYLDGKLVLRGTATKAEGGTKFVIGNVGLDNPIDYFKGKVRAVRISRGERYADEFAPAEQLAPDDATVLLYSAGSVQGEVVNDRSGKGHHGRIESDRPPPTPPKPFAFDGVMEFDGRTHVLTPLERTAPVTLEAWVRPKQFLPDTNQFVIGSDEKGKWGYGLHISTSRLGGMVVPFAIVSREAVAMGEWSHVAAVLGEKETRLYLNGRRAITAPATKKVGGPRFVVGCQGEGVPINHFIGQMRDVRISRDERYTDEFTPAKTLDADGQTLLLYSGSAVEGDVVTDRSGNGNHGRVVRSSK